jgi:serine/threonine protein kinase
MINNPNTKNTKIQSFNFEPDDIFVDKYQVIQHVGSGWEGEVYMVQELETGIERAVKFFFPHQNKSNKTLRYYAKKLHRLRHCNILIQYHTQGNIIIHGIHVTFLVSEFVEGELLSDFIKRQPGKRLQPYQAVHFLYALVKGIEEIHRYKEYHGDIHTENIIVQRYGLGFDLKLVDMFRWDSSSKPENIQDDIIAAIQVFHEILGGADWYAKHDPVIKNICCGLKRSLILKKFRTSTKLREYLETLDWDE